MIRKNIVHIVGARPNFMKLAPVHEALRQYENFNQIIIHGGQHYDHNMSDIFFEEFNLPNPDVNLEISGKSVLQQIGLGIMKLEEVLPSFHPDLVIIYGDINATAYASIVCSKLGYKLAHIEAGLRSFDLSMPEETNRMIADCLSNYFFTPSIDADQNLLKSGIDKENIFFVGNVMIDTLVKFLPKTDGIKYSFQIPDEYGLVTLHRPSNVDDEKELLNILEVLLELSEEAPIVFPIHPRTKSKVPSRFFNYPSNLILIEPLGYLPFLNLQKNAKYIITDSGGVQEEATYLGVPCFTFRKNTERPITVEVGTNKIVGTNTNDLKETIINFLNGDVKKAHIPEYWDGKTAIRIAAHINYILNSKLEPVLEINTNNF
ncbi:MAG: UDP-N-acetylglucosamine 2-epimerase (non-hydrolyzing) [Chitinophagaceae bacterium]